MTCRYSETNWRDVLYNTVRAVPGGINAAAAHLTERRGRSIHPETLRQRLRGVDGDSISMEMAELLTEWMQDLRRPDAKAWLHALNGRFGLAASVVDAPPLAACADEVGALRHKLLEINVSGGRVTEVGLRVTADNKVEPTEAEDLEVQALESIRQLYELVRNARRAAGKDGAA